MNKLYLGIDGGGSATRARLVDASGRTLGTGGGGPSNVRLGPDAAWAAVLSASRAAFAEAGLDVTLLAETSAGLGLAGACVRAAVVAFLARPSPFRRLTLDTDAHAACLGAHVGRPGAIVIVGTGSVAHVWDGKQGRQIGGWGFPISDAGSGAWIGLEAVRLAVAGSDALAPPSALAMTVREHLGGSAEAAVLWADAAGPAQYAAVAPMVLAAAERGDAIAVTILHRAAEHIGQLIEAVIGAPRIALVGGLAATLSPWLDPSVRSRLVAAAGSALDGAIRMIRAVDP
jgi:glucosamine kinase